MTEGDEYQGLTGAHLDGLADEGLGAGSKAPDVFTRDRRDRFVGFAGLTLGAVAALGGLFVGWITPLGLVAVGIGIARRGRPAGMASRRLGTGLGLVALAYGAYWLAYYAGLIVG